MRTSKKSEQGGSKGNKPVATHRSRKTNSEAVNTHGGAREGAGRPPGPWKFKTVKELEKKIQAYFDDCDPHYKWQGIYREKVDKETGDPVMKGKRVEYEEVEVMQLTKQKDYTVSGLCLFMNTNRETLTDYESGKYDLPDAEKKAGELDFSDTVKRAKLAIENYAETKLFGPNATGVIFNLKNNWGWKDAYENKNINDNKVQFVNDVPRPASR